MHCGIPPRGIKVHVRTFSARVGLIAFVSTLAGCGYDSYSPPGTTNVSVAVNALLRQPRSYTLYDGGYQSAILSISPGVTASYKGVNYDTTQLTTTIRSGGVLISTDVQTVWFQSGTMLEFFIQNSSNGCDLATSATALPSSAALGSNFPFSRLNFYSTCSSPANTEPGGTGKLQGTVTQTVSYSLIYGIPMVCINAVNSFYRSTEANCIEIIDANGTLGPRALVSIATSTVVRQYTNF
jgi:hypothetical protein